MKVLWLGFCVSAASFAAEVKVKVKAAEPDKWTPESLALVEKAAGIAFERLRSTQVAQCAYRNSFRDARSKDELRRVWGSQIPVLNKRPEVTIVIHQEQMGDRVLGRAAVDIAKIDRRQYEIHKLEISLNQEQLNQYAKGDANKNVLDQWVNVIAHEVGHNFGHSHGRKGTWSVDYPGYFVTELGFCTMTNGKDGSDLGDPALRRQFREAK